MAEIKKYLTSAVMSTVFFMALLAPAGVIAKVKIKLPVRESTNQFEALLEKRHSVRDFSIKKIPLTELAHLLWAGYGHRLHNPHRKTVPSAGALYPLELYLIVNKVKGLSPGVYLYHPDSESLEFTASSKPEEIFNSALRQRAFKTCAVSVVVCAAQAKTERKYGQRAHRYVLLEAGHVGQNLLLAATKMGFAGVSVGAFDEKNLSQSINPTKGYKPVYAFAFGYERN